MQDDHFTGNPLSGSLSVAKLVSKSPCQCDSKNIQEQKWWKCQELVLKESLEPGRPAFEGRRRSEWS